MERITSRKNPKIQHMKKLGASREYRYECGEFLCDGEKLLEEAIKHGAEITCALYCGEKPALPDGLDGVYETEKEIIEYVSNVVTPQGVVFSCRMAEVGPAPEKERRRLVLDGIQDPGNLGTMVRTANALFYDTVILLPGCADLYNPKTIRATMGAVFRQRVILKDTAYLDELKSAGMLVCGAALSDDSCDIRDVVYDDFALCIGSEGRGLSEAVLSKCSKKIIIPMRTECESLNAAQAAGIIMWETVRC